MAERFWRCCIGKDGARNDRDSRQNYRRITSHKFDVSIKGHGGRPDILRNCQLDTTIGEIKRRYANEFRTESSSRMGFRYRGRSLKDHQTLRHVGNGSWNAHNTLTMTYRTVGGMALTQYDERSQCILFENWKGKKILMSTVHVSCESSKLPHPTETWKGVNILGMILYGYDGKTDWYLNGIHCKTGYLYIRHAKEIEKYKIKKYQTQTGRHTMHAKLYKSLFKVDIDYKKNIIGAGFAIKDGEIKFKSGTFNLQSVTTDDGWHNNNEFTDEIEKTVIYHALGIWRHSRGRTKITRVCDWWAKRNYKPDYLKIKIFQNDR